MNERPLRTRVRVPAVIFAAATVLGVCLSWRTSFLWSAPSHFSGAGFAAAPAWLLAHAGLWLSAFTLAPVFLMYRAHKLYLGRIKEAQRGAQQTSDLHLATIEALARAIDAKDQTAHSHIQRVQLYAVGLAREIGLGAAETQGIHTAALLHDIGKLAVPEHILSKPGPLTQEELQRLRIHPLVGAEILEAVPFPYPVTPLILGHHERWDGKGYPQGLSGVAIPIGARILTIADYYDAVRTERPHHKALSQESAVALLRHEAGKALDPYLVNVFIDLLPSLIADSEAAGFEARAAAPTAVDIEATAPGRLAGSPSAFENIALAHREIYALYDFALAMGTSLGVSDTMALISSKLTKIIPWSGCTLHLQQPDRTLRCCFAAGEDVPQLLNRAEVVDQGLAGWVALNGRTLVNADPQVAFAAAGLSAETSVKSAIVCPLIVGDAFIGALTLYHTDRAFYTEDHQRLMERVAEQAGAVIHNSILFEQTQEDSLTDPLTGLPNRRSMFAHLSRELARAERLDGEVAMIVMDLDDFKAINDTYGHHVGDRALREVAAALQGGLRSYDLCVRYAGDEFIVVLVDCSWEAAEAKRRELQQRVNEIAIECGAGAGIRLAISAGAAVYPTDGVSYETLLAEADHRMYRNKAARRGRIARPRTPRPTGFIAPVEFEPSSAPLDQSQPIA